MKNKFMAAIGVLLVSISCIASTACVCSAANTTPKTMPTTAKTETTTAKTTDTVGEDAGYSFNYIDSFDLYFSRPIFHVTNEVLVLGNDETATITLECTPAGRTDADFVFMYDHSVIYLDSVTVENDTVNDLSKITFTVNKLAPGETDLIICPGYDYYLASMAGKDLNGILSSVNNTLVHFINLDEEDGQVVYASNATKTYSADKAKVGKDALPTTLFDVTALGYTEK